MAPGVTLLEEGEMAVAAAVAHLPQLTRCLLDVWPIVFVRSIFVGLTHKHVRICITNE